VWCLNFSGERTDDDDRDNPEAKIIDRSNNKYLMKVRAEQREIQDKDTALAWRIDSEKRRSALLKRHGPKVGPPFSQQ
jgi:hypothetical protein